MVPTRTDYGTGWSWVGYAPQPDPDQPLLNGIGPAECSSCTELSVLPVWIWDTNRYYRDLGVDPRASRKELREAYQAKDGQSSVRLTYVLSQLLNPAVRFAYDCTPLGELFFDEYIRDMLNRIAKARMSKRMADLARQGADLDMVDDTSLLRDIFAEMGVETEDREAGADHFHDTPPEVVDEPPSSREDEQRPAKFEYSYYLWRTRLRDPALGHERLSQWQRFLVSAFAREGVRLRFAIGFHGHYPQRWLKADIGFRQVFFLNIDEVPTEELARDVALRVRLDRDRMSSRSILRSNPSQTQR